MESKKLLFKADIDVIKHTSKKNRKTIRYNPKTRKPFIATDTSEDNHLKVLEVKLLKARAQNGLKKPLDCEMRAKFLFHYPDRVLRTRKDGSAVTQRAKRLIDLSNLIQGVEDALQVAGVILDDLLIESYDGTRRIYGERSMPAIEIELYEL